jgi:hypothetical protein
MNASISVVCNKSKALSNSENPLMLQISKEGRRKYQSLGISIDQKFWDFTKNKPKPNCPDGDSIQKILRDQTQKKVTPSLLRGQNLHLFREYHYTYSPGPQNLK